MADYPGGLPFDSPSDQEYWQYSAPAIQCKNRRNLFYFPEHCRWIPLPFRNLPTGFERLSDWPDAGWKRIVGCIDCLQLHEYEKENVFWVSLRKSSQARFRNETNCFFVKLECAHRGCLISVEFHIEIFDKTEADLRRVIKKGFVGEWPSCGHPALAAPHSLPDIGSIYLGPI